MLHPGIVHAPLPDAQNDRGDQEIEDGCSEADFRSCCRAVRRGCERKAEGLKLRPEGTDERKYPCRPYSSDHPGAYNVLTDFF